VTPSLTVVRVVSGPEVGSGAATPVTPFTPALGGFGSGRREALSPPDDVELVKPTNPPGPVEFTLVAPSSPGGVSSVLLPSPGVEVDRGVAAPASLMGVGATSPPEAWATPEVSALLLLLLLKTNPCVGTAVGVAVPAVSSTTTTADVDDDADDDADALPAMGVKEPISTAPAFAELAGAARVSAALVRAVSEATAAAVVSEAPATMVLKEPIPPTAGTAAELVVSAPIMEVAAAADESTATAVEAPKMGVKDPITWPAPLDTTACEGCQREVQDGHTVVGQTYRC
jgi:hypothetical protein